MSSNVNFSKRKEIRIVENGKLKEAFIWSGVSIAGDVLTIQKTANGVGAGGDECHIQLVRHCALTWWNSMNLEDKFYKTIKHNDLIEGDRTRHPDTLTGREIEIIYNAEHVA